MAEQTELSDALRRIDMDYGRRKVGSGDEEHYMRAECDCGTLLLEQRPFGNSNRDNLNLLDVVTAALDHRKTCTQA